MIFVVLKAVTADEILRGTKVVEEVGRMRLRRWEEIREGEELHQCVFLPKNILWKGVCEWN